MIYLAAFLTMLFAALLLTGCVKKYSRGDIGAYAKKMTGRSSLTVSDSYTEIQEDEEGYLDHLWTITDEENGITFHVLDDYYWALEQVENQLLDDYDSSVFLQLLDQQKIPKENGLSLKKAEFSGLVNAEITCSYTDLKSLEVCYKELEAVRDALENAGYPGSKVKFTVQYRSPLYGAVNYDDEEGNTTGEIGSLDESTLNLMRRNYLACALDYRFEEAMREFSQEEIEELIHSADTVRIYRTGGNGEEEGKNGSGSSDGDPDYYEGVIGSPKYMGISFGTLYEILKMEGYGPEGTPWHYKVTLPDGSRLEFSYDFNDLSGFNDKNGKLQSGYYYLLDDKKVRMSSYYANHFEAPQITSITGLHLAEDRPYVTENSE